MLSRLTYSTKTGVEFMKGITKIPVLTVPETLIAEVWDL